MEAEEQVVVVEEERLSTLDLVAYGDVEHDDSRMGMRELCSEFASDEFTIDAQLFSSMGESEGNSAGCEIPG